MVFDIKEIAMKSMVELCLFLLGGANRLCEGACILRRMEELDANL